MACSNMPVPGEDACKTLLSACGPGLDGAHCLKAALESALPNSSLVAEWRRVMVIPRDWYFLCGPIELAASANSERVRALTDRLRWATSSVPGSAAAAVALDEYHTAARWSSLVEWQPAEKIEHFLQTLDILPDNLHAIDRLATALSEARQPRARVMLLHYAVLRGVVVHPLQRPLQLWRGLRGQPFWDSGDASFAWLPKLLVPSALAAMRQESASRGQQEMQAHSSAAPAVVLQCEGVHKGGVWREMHLVRAGQWARGVAQFYPETSRLLQESGIEIINARLSRMTAGTHVTPHCGISNAKLRVHIPLQLPGATRRLLP